jgi:glutamate mutase epsilon subunit
MQPSKCSHQEIILKTLIEIFLYIIKFDVFNKIKGDICSGTINAFATGGMDMIHGISQVIVWTTESCSHMWQM